MEFAFAANPIQLIIIKKAVSMPKEGNKEVRMKVYFSKDHLIIWLVSCQEIALEIFWLSRVLGLAILPVSLSVKKNMVIY